MKKALIYGDRYEKYKNSFILNSLCALTLNVYNKIDKSDTPDL